MNIIIKTFYFNQTKNKSKQVKDFISVLNSNSKLQQIGGLLFKSNFQAAKETIYIEFVPTLLDGERSYHYNIKLKHEDEYNLVGSVSANGEFKILIKPESAELSNENKEKYLISLKAFAQFLIEHDYNGMGIIDWTTTEILKALGCNKHLPKNIKELSNLKLINS